MDQVKISRKGIKRNVTLTHTTLKPCNRGRNARGTCAHKTTHLAKKVNQLQTGYAPTEVTAYRMRIDRV